MISRTRKKVEEPESDSDWDSLPGDVVEPGSSPEPKQVTPRASSLSPVPPKQPNTHGKQTGSSKPLNIYKNNIGSSKKGSGATTFEDRSGGLWNDEENEIHFSKESNNNVRGNKILKENKEKRNVYEQEQQKRPPFTDFKEALSTPIPPSANKKDHHEMSGVNQAYRFDKEDQMHGVNHDSWDESENESVSQALRTQEHQKGKNVMTMKQQHVGNMNSEPEHKLKTLKRDKHGMEHHTLEMVHHQHHQAYAKSDIEFENCCMVQVANGPFDNRYQPSFFHGSKDHFHIKEDDPRAAVTDIAEKSELILQRFWREVFGVVQILINFFIIFILELFKVLVRSLRIFITGILYIIGDHFTKPLLAAVFNNMIQPFAVLLLNIFTILANLLRPVLALTRELFSQVSIPLKAFRLFELNWGSAHKEDDTRADVKII